MSSLPLSSLNQSPRRRAAISLTPLVDVVFILLVFFMLASSFLEWRTIDVAAPVSQTAGSAMTGAVLIEVRARDVRLSGEPLSVSALATRITAIVAARPDQSIAVKPAAGIDLQRLVSVLDALGDAGAANVSLVNASPGAGQ